MAFETITNHVAAVRQKLGNRTDIDTRIENWLRDAYRELAYAYPFDELYDSKDTSTIGPVGSTVTSRYDYPTSIGVNNAEVRGLRSLAIIDSSNVSILLERRSIRYIDEYSTTVPSRPSIYATWAEQTATGVTRFVELRPVPNTVYTLRWRLWLLPIIAGTIGDTILRVPFDWLEIIDYAAALRGFSELLEHDRANAIRDLLYGFIDPTNGRRQPGLITSRMTNMQAEYAAGIISTGPLAQRYSHH